MCGIWFFSEIYQCHLPKFGNLILPPSNGMETRLSSIESQPKKVVFVVGLFLVVGAIIFSHKNLTLRFG